MCLSVPCWSLFSKDDGQQGAGRRASAKRRIVTVGATVQQRLRLTRAVSSLSNLFIILLTIGRQSVLSAGAVFPPFPRTVPRLFISNWEPSRVVFLSASLKHWRFCLSQRNPAGMDYKAPPGLGTKSQCLLGSKIQFIAPISCSKTCWGEHPLGHTGASPVAV